MSTSKGENRTKHQKTYHTDLIGDVTKSSLAGALSHCKHHTRKHRTRHEHTTCRRFRSVSTYCCAIACCASRFSFLARPSRLIPKQSLQRLQAETRNKPCECEYDSDVGIDDFYQNRLRCEVFDQSGTRARRSRLGLVKLLELIETCSQYERKAPPMGYITSNAHLSQKSETRSCQTWCKHDANHKMRKWPSLMQLGQMRCLD